MNQAQTKSHWEGVWTQKQPEETSWHQDEPGLSLAMIGRSGLARGDGLIDVGCGASSLAPRLLASGYRDITVLDVSEAALREAKKRLGRDAGKVEWFVADVREFEPPRRYALWHDRAVFHFLTDPADQRRYVQTLERSVLPQASLIIATFAPGGPEKCSGLDIVQHDASSIRAVLGKGWDLIEEEVDMHRTPGGATQKFGFYRFERRNARN